MEINRSIHWFAIHTKPCGEEIATAYISHLGLEVFLPRISRQAISPGKDRFAMKPLFTGYLFARFCPANNLHSVRYARGVRGVVSAGDIPLPVDAKVIELIRQRVAHDYSKEMGATEIRSGEEVVIRGGALAGLRAILERKINDQDRVMLLLNTIHHQARVWIDGRSLCSATQV
jgi:transcriptional antiterminator RfaH